MPSRSEGERTRARQALDRLKACLHGVEIAIEDTTPIGSDAAQAVSTTAVDLAMTLSRLDAYTRAETDLTPATSPFPVEGSKLTPREKKLEMALRRILALCKDRQKFVTLGPRMFQAAVSIAEEALE